MGKERIEVPDRLRAMVLFQSDHTCCLCRIRGRAVQIHHIDEDPSDNSEANLAILCLLCHNETMVRGGFGRRLAAEDVRQYRDDWIARVAKRRDDADQTVEAATKGFRPSSAPRSRETLRPYLQSLPVALECAYEDPEMKWGSGTTADMNHATHIAIDVVEQMLVQLAAWYPPDHFEELPALEYFAARTAAKFRWFSAVSEPDGPGTGGTIVSTMVAGSVLDDLERDVVQMVLALLGHDMREFNLWIRDWRAAAKSAQTPPADLAKF